MSRDYEATPTSPDAGRRGASQPRPRPSEEPRPLPREVARPFTYGVRHETVATSQECPQSVSGHDPSGTRDGTCVWCSAQIDSRPPPPRLSHGYLTEAEAEYRRFYDPDYGSDWRDI